MSTSRYPTPRWSQGQRQSFQDGVRQRAITIAGRRNVGPTAAEWEPDDYDDDLPYELRSDK